ncbi:MAG: BrnA antitoxin family protein [Deltaproteobacteria bacterium]|nr:BrnA antitoxin family protein [Candidatus Deferrimicrobium borealis]
MRRKPLTDKSGEVRELTREDIRAMRPAIEVLPPELLAILPKRKPGQRGPQRAPVKKKISLRVDAEVLAYYKATGPGLQGRVNEALKKAALGKSSRKGRAA